MFNFFKIRSFVFIFILLSIFKEHVAYANSITISTGINASGGLIAEGLPDPNWTVTYISPQLESDIQAFGCLALLNTNADVVDAATGWTTSATSGWINCSNCNLFFNSASAALRVAKYTRQFVLSAAATINFNLEFADDNWVSDISVSGGGSIPSGQVGPLSHAGSFHSVSSSFALSAGLHSITFTVNQDYIGPGLLNNSGLNVRGTIKAAADVIFDENQCKADEFIVNHSSEIPAAGGVFEHTLIEGGSNAGSGGSGSTAVAVPRNKSTIFIAGLTQLSPNFKAEVLDNGLFEVIPVTDCGKCKLVTPITVGPLTTFNSFGTPEVEWGSDCFLAVADATPGGTWSSGNNLIARVGSDVGSPNLIWGVSDGEVTITYTVDGCSASLLILVDGPCRGSGKRDFRSSDDFANTSGNISVYPNPATNQITITYPCTANGQLAINIKDVAGRTMYTENVACDEGNIVQHTVDINSFAAGVYFIELTVNDQHIVKKMVKL